MSHLGHRFSVLPTRGALCPQTTSVHRDLYVDGKDGKGTRQDPRLG